MLAAEKLAGEAILLHKRGQLPLAAAKLRQALELNPDSESARKESTVVAAKALGLKIDALCVAADREAKTGELETAFRNCDDALGFASGRQDLEDRVAQTLARISLDAVAAGDQLAGY